MRKLFSQFKKSEDGAVTVDWVVLTGVMAGFGLAVAAVIIDGATDEAAGVGAFVGNIEIDYEPE